jgi:glycosyltransferase involved in cell wall biosynthesis
MGSQVSIALCVRNCVALVRDNLPSVRSAVPDAEIIVVDGNSTDGTFEAASKYADKVVSDEGKGLAYARQLGITTASRPYVLFIGADNRIDVPLIEAMQTALLSNEKLAGVAPQTMVMDPKSYWEKATKQIFIYFINRPGPADVIGTPCMWKRDVILKIPYDAAIRGGADDTDLALRLQKLGFTLQIIDAYSEERNSLDFSGFFSRWKFYGSGDAEFYAKHKSDWTLKRKLRSLIHPLNKYALKGTWLFFKKGCPQYIPALYVGMFARYWGWYKRVRTL